MNDIIYYCIYNHCDLTTQYHLKQLDTYFYDCLHIINLYDISTKHKDKLCDEILIKLEHVKYLYASYNTKIKNIRHMVNLRKLNVCNIFDECEITDDEIKNLNLVELDASWNSKIKNIGHMTNLQILYASNNCGITDDEIKNLNLIELDASDNQKIKNIKHMTNLRKSYLSD